MSIMAIAVPVDLAKPLRLEQLEPSNLDAYRRLVGGHLQFINLERPVAAMYLNDEGKLDGL
jgi:hypothetical protein